MRATVTILAIVIGLAFAAAMFFSSSGSQPAPAPTPTTQAAPPVSAATTQAGEPTAPTKPASATTQRAEGNHPETAVNSAASPATQAFGLLPDLHPLPSPTEVSAILGSDADNSAYRARVDLTYFGAGIKQITLEKYKKEARGKEPYLLAQTLVAGAERIYPYAARRLFINGHDEEHEVKGFYKASWELLPGYTSERVVYRLVIASGDTTLLEIARTYTLRSGSYDLLVREEFRNDTDQPLSVVWEQNAQGDITADPVIRGDDRSFAAGYFNLDYDAKRSHIYTDNALVARTKLLDDFEKKGRTFWPNPDVKPRNELAWIASLNRYFALVTHPLPIGTPSSAANFPHWFDPAQGAFAQVGMEVIGHNDTQAKVDGRQMVFTLVSRPMEIAPDATATLENGLFAGPRESDLFKAQPYASLDFDKLIVYAMGCAWCTFQPLARGLLWFLEVIHAVTFDWGIAIIILVLVVRLILHPITKRAQINMARLGKQMGAIKPEIEKIKKKYGTDTQAINKETMALYRERGVNPANMLGCLPMFLQTPIWAALYAMLSGAIELRQQPAFYGVFQKISGGRWSFLGDLARADEFIRLPAAMQFTIPFIGIHVEGVNLLPILMAFVFYMQQKLMQPPAADDQAAQQQKIMKWMTLLFPVMLYSYPCGLNLYILASTAAGIVDSVIVKKHIKREEDEGRLFTAKPPKSPKTGGWREKMMSYAEEKQRQMKERPDKRRR